MLSSLAHRLADEAVRIPLLRPVLTREYKRRFDAASGSIRLFHGIYPDFASALGEIPVGRLQGYDNEPSALRLAHERLRIRPCDYPVMFWLQKLLPECGLLFDLGGNVGISYFGYRKYLEYTSALEWVVNDVPAVVALGEQIAREQAATNLRFTTSLDELPRADVLLASGSLHFIEEPFGLLRSATALPRHVLVNKVPLRDLPAAVTLHNMGSAMCAYHLFNRTEFLTHFRMLGYDLIDEWETPDLSARIPLFREHSIRAYSGFYFKKPRV